MKAILVTEPSELISIADLMLQLRIDSESSLDGPDEAVMVYAEDELTAMLTAAREQVEHVTRRALITQRWKYYLDGFPSGDRIKLPLGNLQSLLSLTIANSACTETNGTYALIFTGSCDSTATGTYTIASNVITAVTLTYGGTGYASAPTVATQSGHGSVAATLATVKWKDTAGTVTTLTHGTDYIIETNGPKCGEIVLPYGESWPSNTLYPSNPITIEFLCGWKNSASVPRKIKQAALMVAVDLYQNRSTKNESSFQYKMDENKTATTFLSGSKLWDEF
jgi:hypothetical protein